MHSLAGWRLASWAFACFAAPVAICSDPANITIAKLSDPSSRRGPRRPGVHSVRPERFAATKGRILPACGGSQRTAAALKTKTFRLSIKRPGARCRSKAADQFWRGILPRSATLIIANKVDSRDRLSGSNGVA